MTVVVTTVSHRTMCSIQKNLIFSYWQAHMLRWYIRTHVSAKADYYVPFSVCDFFQFQSMLPNANTRNIKVYNRVITSYSYHCDHLHSQLRPGIGSNHPSFSSRTPLIRDYLLSEWGICLEGSEIDASSYRLQTMLSNFYANINKKDC